MADPGYSGPRSQATDSSHVNALRFLAQQVVGERAHATLVQVKAVTNTGGVSPVGFVDVQPMVAQVDGEGKATPHATIHKLPYFRLQGGGKACVICDPVKDDIGIAIFADRDISSVKNNKAPSNPGSFRQNDWADGLYIGGFLNDTPTTYIQFDGNGTVNIVTDADFTVTTQGDVTVDAQGDVSVTTQGDATIDASGGSVTITSDDVSLGATGGAAVARVGDNVNLTTGKITSGSAKVTAA